MLLPQIGADVTAIRLLEIEIDFGAAVGTAAIGVVFAESGDVRAAGLARTLGKGDDLGRRNASGSEKIPHGVSPAGGELVVVGFSAKGIGVPTESDFFAGVGAKDESDNFELAASARVDLVFVEFEVEGKGVATLGIFDEGRVINVTTRDAAGIIGKQLVEVDFGNDPVGWCGWLAQGKGKLCGLGCIGSLDIGKVANGVAPLKHGS